MLSSPNDESPANVEAAVNTEERNAIPTWDTQNGETSKVLRRACRLAYFLLLLEHFRKFRWTFVQVDASL
ncbi:ubiquitin-conjugating enzyme E2 [Actinidia rufa]|uniref:Ubiquitin-conjugating enzyme E2 n=1 Tax=Actinidia rufa TaxID=165716 RepID=A0A7J0GVT5_9ERIC|nr:ubiquitin-conjugating enzyme E2 [Actinidia rufa]